MQNARGYHFYSGAEIKLRNSGEYRWQTRSNKWFKGASDRLVSLPDEDSRLCDSNGTRTCSSPYDKTKIKAPRILEMLFWSGLRVSEIKTTKCCFYERCSTKQGERRGETCETKTHDYATRMELELVRALMIKRKNKSTSNTRDAFLERITG